MVERSDVEPFIDDYRRAFERIDVARVARYLAFPLHVTGDAAEVTVVSIPTLEARLPQVERIVGAYRLLGVASARPGDIRIRLVTERSRRRQSTGPWMTPRMTASTTSTPRTRSPTLARGCGSPLSPTTSAQKMMAALARQQAASRIV